MQKIRPKNLDLFTIRLPLPAIVSILHRISGVLLFLSIPFILWIWSLSLTDSGFDTISQCLASIYMKLLVWLLLAAFSYHLIAGIRHLLSDIGIGESLAGGRKSSKLVFIIFIIFILLAGIWLW